MDVEVTRGEELLVDSLELEDELPTTTRREVAMAECRAAAGVEEVHILWISEGMSCDGDSVSITAAGQPSIEDVVLGAIPGLPKVHLHNKVLSPTRAARSSWRRSARPPRGELDAPFVLVIEGSIPNENINGEGYWTSFGNDPATGEPMTLNWWIDRLAPKAWGVVAIGTCATYGGIHAMAGNPTGCMGLADYLGWDFRSAGGLPIVNVPGCPVQPDNFMETLTWLLYQAAGLAPMIPLDDSCARSGSSARPCTRAATAPATTSRATSPWTTTRPSAR